MILTIKSKHYSAKNTDLILDILNNTIENLNDYLEKIIICDEEDLEKEIKLYDSSVSITKMPGCAVCGKTISHYNKSIIFISTNILKTFYDNISVNDNNVIYNDQSLISLRTFYHEIGHAKRNHQYGSIVTKEIAHSYEELLSELWNILRDEYFAEMCCANILKLKDSVDWYDKFDDAIESENFEYYLSTHKDNGLVFDGNVALQMMHQYYFVPLFQKAGFLKSASKILSLNSIDICQTIQEIQECNVIENEYVPLRFNDIVLRKWSDFQIENKLNN